MNGYSAALGRVLMFLGMVLILLSLLMRGTAKFPLGRLPGDIYVTKGGITFYFPLISGLIVSLLVTLIFSLFRR